MKRITHSPLRLIAFLISLFIVNSAFSQDDIIMQNNDVVKGRVDEIGEHHIKYHRADNPDGPVYEITKSDVYMIVFANGTSQVINEHGAVSDQDNVPAPDAPVTQAPPEMPVYDQPICPAVGYLWTPGYWAFGIDGYYWVPGVWVAAPHPGYLWTPCYWGFENGIYVYHEGYWGEHIGFYGGVNYGYGYGGHGYDGGRWEGGAFRYNTAVSRVDVNIIHTTYVDRTVIHEGGSRVSFNGVGGVRAEATVNERTAMNEHHDRPTVEQQSHIASARSDKSQYVANNGGRPAVTAMNKPGGQHFSSTGAVTQAHPNSQPAHPAGNPQQHNAAGADIQSHPTGNTQSESHTTGNSQAQQQHPVSNTQSQTHPATGTQSQHNNGNSSAKYGSKPGSRPATKPAPKPVTRPEEKR